MAFPRIDNVIEQWATIYKPISHDPTRGSKQKRFFRFNSFADSADFQRRSHPHKFSQNNLRTVTLIKPAKKAHIKFQ